MDTKELLLQELLETVQGSKAFVLEQAPLVYQEMVRYGIISAQESSLCTKRDPV